MIGKTTGKLTQEFMISRDLNPEIKAPVWHFALSLPHHETDKLNDEQLADLATKHFAGMVILAKAPDALKDKTVFSQQREEFIEDKLPEYQFFVAKHDDTQHKHVHVVASRISVSDGKAIETWRDSFRSQKVLRQLEEEYLLEAVPCSWEVGKRAPTKSQLEKLAKTGIESVQVKLQNGIELAAVDSPTMPELINRLLHQGIEVRVPYTRTGKVKGVSYSWETGEVDKQGQPIRVAMQGNQLGERYSFPGLQKHMKVSYDPDRDDVAIRELLTNKESSFSIETSMTSSTVAARVIEENASSTVEGSRGTKKLSQQVGEDLKRNQRLDGEKSKSNEAAIAAGGDIEQANSRLDEIRAAQEQFRRTIDKLEQSVTEFTREVARGEDIWQQYQSDSGEKQTVIEVVDPALEQDITNEADAQQRDNNLLGDSDNTRDVSRDSSLDTLATALDNTAINIESEQRQNQQFNDNIAPLETRSQQKGDYKRINSQSLFTDTRGNNFSDTIRTGNKKLWCSNIPKQFRPQTELDKVQQERAKAIYPIALRMYEQYTQQVKIIDTASGTVVVEGKYQLIQDSEKNTLVLTANDGRGELIRYKSKDIEYVANLTRIDIENWKAIEQQLNQVELILEQQTRERSNDVDLEL